MVQYLSWKNTVSNNFFPYVKILGRLQGFQVLFQPRAALIRR